MTMIDTWKKETRAMITSITSPFQDAIVATPQPYAREVVQNRLAQQRDERGYWKNHEERIKFRVFILLDGKKHHRRISEILHISEPEVRIAIIHMMVERLVSIEERAKESTMNVQLLHQSFTAIKPHGMAFAEHFYQHLFELGRTTLGTNEIEYLFVRTDMQKQYAALLGALAYVIAGVLENKDIKSDLIELGVKHRQKHVKNEYYPLVGQSLIATLQWYFGPNWTTELQTTWTLAYEFVSNAMMEAV
jgi:hemoglobin-like flavoprotein